jgi:hypothetical protein
MIIINSDILMIIAGCITLLNILIVGFIYLRIGASLKITSPDPFTYLFYSQLFLDRSLSLSLQI